jgi:Ca2+-binding EF-hand superfamily protein
MHPGLATAFPNGQSTLQFDEFIEMIRESCADEESAENYLVYAFSMFDRQK